MFTNLLGRVSAEGMIFQILNTLMIGERFLTDDFLCDNCHFPVFLLLIMLVLVHVQGFKPKTLNPKPRMAKGLKKQKQMGLQIGEIILTVCLTSRIGILQVVGVKWVVIVYVESIARVKKLSLTGLLLYKLGVSDQFFVQWSQLKARFPNTIYMGRLM